MDLRQLTGSWSLAMDAEGISRNTMRTYLMGVNQLLDWADDCGTVIDLEEPEDIRRWLVHLRDRDMADSTRRTRLASVRSFAAWLVGEGEIKRSGAHSVDWPKLGERVPDALTDEDLHAILATCDSKTFTGARDEAILRLLYDALLRSDELLGMSREGSVDLRTRTVRVIGKGNRERYSGFSKQTATALDRYQRHRARQRNSHLPAYWLALGRGALTYAGLYWMCTRRGDRAGVDMHPHMARAGGAIKWRKKGGSVPGLMAVAGWKTVGMVNLYTAAAEKELALEEQRRLHDQG